MKNKSTKIYTGTETKVQQHFKEETDINNIVAKFSQTGELPYGNAAEPQYLDHTQFSDYTEMLNQVTHVKQVFDQYGSRIRAKFENQPAKMLAFLEDPKNHNEARELGILPKLIVPDSQRAGAPLPEPAKGVTLTDPPQGTPPSPEGLKTPPDGNKEA